MIPDQERPTETRTSAQKGDLAASLYMWHPVIGFGEALFLVWLPPASKWRLITISNCISIKRKA